MEYTVKAREKEYDYYRVLVEDEDEIEEMKKEVKLGQGEQGSVYKMRIKKGKEKKYIAMKRFAVEKKNVKHLKNLFTKSALKEESFIEYASMQLVNELVLQRICPNYVLNYGWSYKERKGVCDDSHPYKMYLYNEYVDKVELFSDWMDKRHKSSEWFNVYFQILVAIYGIREKFNLVHSDLHSFNIFIKKVKKGGYWKYRIEGKDYYVPNLGFVILMNDFGHGWIPSIFESWYVRERLKEIDLEERDTYDVKTVLELVLEYGEAPKYVRDVMEQGLSLIEKGGKSITLNDIIYTIWGSSFMLSDIGDDTKECQKRPWHCYHKKPKGNTKMIEEYNLDKKIDLRYIPKELRKMVTK